MLDTYYNNNYSRYIKADGTATKTLRLAHSKNWSLAMDYLDLRDLAKEFADFTERSEDEDNSDPLDEAEQERFDALKALAADIGSDLETAADNEPTMIPVSEFEDYCQELAEDCGYLSRSDTNPLMRYIDWQAWARDNAYDYTQVAFDGVEYYIRSW